MDVFTLAAKLTLNSKEYDDGLTDAKKNAEDFSKTWNTAKGQFASGAKSIAVGAGAIAGVGTAAFKAADALSKNLDEIDKTSQKVGMSTKAYQEWDYVLKISGTEMSNMTTGLKTLTNKFDDAKKGGKGAVDAFAKLGLKMEDIQDLSREDLFGTVITAFQNMEDSADRAALANELFGKSGQDLTPLFNTTAEETRKLIEEVNHLGGVMSEDAVKDGAAFQDSLTALKTAFAGASGSLLSELVPAITKLMGKVTEFVASGGIEKIISTLKTLAPVIGIVVGAFAGFQIISGIVSLVQGFSTAFGILNAVMAANPIGIIIAAIAALVAAFVLLWNNCEGFRDFWITVWEGIKNAFSAVAEFISDTFSKFGEWASAAWEGIKNVFAAVGGWFSEKFTAAKEAVSNAWEGIKERMSERWNQIKDAFANVGSWFSEKFTEAKDNAVNAWNNIKEKASEIWGWFKDGFSISDALTWGRDMMQNFIDGIKQKWENLKESLRNIGQSIKDFIGFSEPKKGPLSDFHTYAPDMMELFAQGIKDNEHLITDQLAESFDLHPTLNANANVGSNGGTQRTTIGFDIDTDGLVRYLRPYIVNENARIGSAMVT